MNQRNAALLPLLDMENDVADVIRWGHALVAMGSGANHIQPGAAYVVGVALAELGKQLDLRWSRALDAARSDGSAS